MNVFAAFSGLPLWFIASLLLCVIPVVAALAAFLIRRGVGFERLVLSNEIAGFPIFDPGRDVRRAPGPGGGRGMGGFPRGATSGRSRSGRVDHPLPSERRAAGAEPDSLRSALLGYGHAVLEDEWPAMARLAGSDAATTAMRRLRHVLVSVEVTDQRGAAVYSEMLDRLADLTEARRSRLDIICRVRFRP